MKKIIPILLTPVICLWAADFWQTKPYTEWTEKEIQKIQTNSPWAKEVPVSLGVGGGPDTGRSKRGGNGSSGDLDSGSGSSGSGGRGNTQEVGGGAVPTTTSLPVIVSWRTALPIREAVAKEKFGAEAATSADAKKMIDEEQKFYAIMVSGLPGRSLRGDEKMKETLLQNTTLSVKGKGPIQATDLKTGGNERSAIVLFLFPKAVPLSVEDKDVEFSTRFGPITVRQKFRLKDMVLNGKLDL